MADQNNETTLHPNCVASAILCGWTGRLKGHDVRIAISKIDKQNNIDHAQAEIKMGDNWIPLTNLWDNEKGQTVRTWQRHFPDVEPYRYLPLEDFVKEQQQFLKGGQ